MRAHGFQESNALTHARRTPPNMQRGGSPRVRTHVTMHELPACQATWLNNASKCPSLLSTRIGERIH